MNNKLMMGCLPVVLTCCWVIAVANKVHLVSHSPKNDSPPPSCLLQDSIFPSDTTPVKYQGYRLQFTDFEVIKKTNDWLRIRFTVVNSGRQDVDFRKKGREHWVQFVFDQTLFDAKLGGFREHIQHTLIAEAFMLEAGKMVRNKELKISTTPPTVTAIAATTEPTPKEATHPDATNELTPKGGGDETIFEPEFYPVTNKDECPDIFFAKLTIVEQDDKWATLEYTITNQGKGAFHLYGEKDGKPHHLAIRAYISGVEVLSRGALPIGAELVKQIPGQAGFLQTGESYSGKVKLDVRKKTRYMKCLILSLESDQFAEECNKSNNTGTVVLD